MKDIFPRIVVCPDETAVDRYVAGEVIEEIKANPELHLTLPTGNTPIGMYRLLVEAYKQGEISFKDLVIFNLDEYWPMDPNSPDSYRSFMRQHLIGLIDIPYSSWHIPKGDALDPNAEAVEYDQLIQSQGIDHAYLGLGPKLTNHIGFNERGSSINSRTRLVTLDPETILVNKQLFKNPMNMPNTALTQGLGTILEAKKITMIIKGAAKADGVVKFLLDPISPDSPASFLRTRDNVTVVLDQAAARVMLEQNEQAALRI
jgi:glucosamine-6-phosphate deaminase